MSSLNSALCPFSFRASFIFFRFLAAGQVRSGLGPQTKMVKATRFAASACALYLFMNSTYSFSASGVCGLALTVFIVEHRIARGCVHLLDNSKLNSYTTL